MSKNNTRKNTQASHNSIRSLVNTGVDALFKASKSPQSSHVAMLLKAYALEGKDKNQEPLKNFNQWEGAKGTKLSQATLQVLFLFKDRYNIVDLLRKHNNSATTASKEIIAHLTATLFKSYGKAQNSYAEIRAAKAKEFGKLQNIKKANLLRNISPN